MVTLQGASKGKKRNTKIRYWRIKGISFSLGQGREKACDNILEVRSIMDATSFEVGV